ncbi:hypothetical protein J2Y74_001394 [Pseudomonas migulae]|nr:hypothetical protein [Pseudomonas migulae]
MPGCPLRRTSTRPLEGALRSKAQGELTLGLMSGENQKRTPIPVGAGLPAKNVGATRSFRQPALSLTSIASKLAPTGERQMCLERTRSTVGAGLPAIAVGQSPSFLTGRTPSPASWLLQGNVQTSKLVQPPQCGGVHTTKEPGRLSGRLGGCGGSCPLERPSGGSAQWATRHGCRVSRPRPGMADGGGPTEQDRSEGMASISEPPNERGKSAWLLGASPSDSL